jgi:hypothetical protein
MPDVKPIAETYLADMRARFASLRSTAEGALDQTSDDDFFRSLGGAEDNSIAIVVKHMAGNLRSRFTDFLTSDGEKPDRDRDGEFEVRQGDTREQIMEQWNMGWVTLLGVLETLHPADLDRTVTIRGESHPVVGALDRQLSHHAYHVGQIVLLAKHYAGSAWKTLSIPRGKSAEVNARMQATR